MEIMDSTTTRNAFLLPNGINIIVTSKSHHQLNLHSDDLFSDNMKSPFIINKQKVKWIRGLCLKENEGRVDAFSRDPCGVANAVSVVDAWEKSTSASSSMLKCSC